MIYLYIYIYKSIYVRAYTYLINRMLLHFYNIYNHMLLFVETVMSPPSYGKSHFPERLPTWQFIIILYASPYRAYI